jgi:hypothetical protein
MRIGSLLQYFCSNCGKILKENTTFEFKKDQLKEECSCCGALLLNTLQNRRKLFPSLLQQEEVAIKTSHKTMEDLSVAFQTAYRQIKDNSIKFAFDINQIDSHLNLNAHGSLCLIGQPKYTELLIDRFCAYSMLPKRHGGLAPEYSKIISVDAGNCTDVYQFVEFARQYGLDVKRVLQNMVVSRVFTIYQLADLVVHELPKIVDRLSSTIKIIVVNGLLRLFLSDPHIDKKDAKNLIKEISSSLRKLSKDRFVIVSFAHCNVEYNQALLPVFNKSIEITEDTDNHRLLQTHVYDQPFKRKVLSHSAALRKEDLTLVPSR